MASVNDLAGLYYNRARWYDANIGRFISEDPIGFGSSDTNLYRYAGNDPVNFRDPSGLFFEDSGFNSGGFHFGNDIGFGDFGSFDTSFFDTSFSDFGFSDFSFDSSGFSDFGFGSFGTGAFFAEPIDLRFNPALRKEFERKLAQALGSLVSSEVERLTFGGPEDVLRLLADTSRGLGSGAARGIEQLTVGSSTFAGTGGAVGSVFEQTGNLAGSLLDVKARADSIRSTIIETTRIANEQGFALAAGEVLGTNSIVAGTFGFDPITGDFVENRAERFFSGIGQLSGTAAGILSRTGVNPSLNFRFDTSGGRLFNTSPSLRRGAADFGLFDSKGTSNRTFIGPLTEPQSIASKAAFGFDNFECIQCTDAVVTAIKGRGFSGQIRQVSSQGHIGTTRVRSSQSIGFQNHFGVQVDDLIFDNISPFGVPVNDFFSSLFTSRGNTIKVLPFEPF